jgi:hypothetical protein
VLTEQSGGNYKAIANEKKKRSHINKQKDKEQRNLCRLNEVIGAKIAQSFIAKGYGLDGRSSIPERRIFIFSTASRPALGPTQPPIQLVPGASFPGGKETGA